MLLHVLQIKKQPQNKVLPFFSFLLMQFFWYEEPNSKGCVRNSLWVVWLFFSFSQSSFSSQSQRLSHAHAHTALHWFIGLIDSQADHYHDAQEENPCVEDRSVNSRVCQTLTFHLFCQNSLQKRQGKCQVDGGWGRGVCLQTAYL